MRLDSVYENFKAALHKDASGNVTNVKKFNGLLEIVNISLFNKKAGLPEMYRPGQPYPPESFDVTQAASEDVAPFIERLGGDQAQALVVNGWVTLPEKFVRLHSLSYVRMSGGMVKVIPFGIAFGGEIKSVLSNTVVGPTERNPIATFQGKRIEIFPKTLKRVDLTYYRLPNTPFFDFIVVNDREQYLPPGEIHDGTGELPSGALSRSVEVEWSEGLIPTFIDGLVSRAAIRIGGQAIYQDAERRKMTGQ